VLIVADLTKPPPNAVNRGIGIQGISTIFSGFLGTGSGVSSPSENVGNIGITRVSIPVIKIIFNYTTILSTTHSVFRYIYYIII